MHGLNTIVSKFPVKETIERMVSIIEAEGWHLFARIDHAKHTTALLWSVFFFKENQPKQDGSAVLVGSGFVRVNAYLGCIMFLISCMF